MRHIRLYRAVDEVARRSSIRAAASVLAISPSALNRQILGLEEDLGVELFERLPRGVRLSTAGEIYIRSFRLHLNELDRAAAQIADLSGLRTGAVRVGVGPELSAYFAPSVIGEFRSSFAGVSVETVVTGCDEASAALNNFDVDFVVAANPILDGSLEIEHAESYPIACLGAELRRGERPLRLSDLQDKALICHRNGSGLRRALDAAFAAKRIEPRYSIAVDLATADAIAHNPQTTLLALELDIDPATAERLGVTVASLRPDDAAEVSVQILKLRARRTPVIAARLIAAFARRLI